MRIQIKFDGSNILQKVEFFFIDYGIYDPTLEKIEDVSILFGGTSLQHPHADHARFFSHYHLKGGDPKKPNLGCEISRKKYNKLVNSIIAISSIMIDLSKDNNGFHLAIPSSYAEIQNDNKNIKTIFGNETELFEIIKKDEKYKSDINKKEFTMHTINIKNGVQFIGDFHHAGTNNMYKLNEKERGLYKKIFKILQNLIDANGKYDEKLQRNLKYNIEIANHLKHEMVSLHKCGRFFCKTKPVEETSNNTSGNIYTMNADVCEYTNYKKPTLLSNDALIDTSLHTEKVGAHNNETDVVLLARNSYKYIDMNAAKNIFDATQEFLGYYLEIDKYINIMNKYDKKKPNIPFYNDYKTHIMDKKINFQAIKVINFYNRSIQNHSEEIIKEWHMNIHLPLNEDDKTQFGTINWLVVKPSSHRSSPLDISTSLGVYSARRFEKNALIGIFFQKDQFNEKTAMNDDLKYAFRSKKYGIINTKYPIGTGPNCQFDMAMHMIVRNINEEQVNAIIDDYGLVKATTVINPNDEIYITKKRIL